MQPQTPKVVLTGATGFVGRAIVASAERQGIPLIPIGGPSQRAGNSLTADVTDADSLGVVFRRAQVLIHAAGLAHVFGRAARDPARFEAINVHGTANAVRVAIREGLEHVVLLSSVAVYGAHGAEAVTEDHKCLPHEPYGVSKLRAEEVARSVAGSSIGLTILRMSTVYGEGDRGNIARLIDAIRRHRFVLIGRGKNRKTLIHKDDAARACLMAVLRRPSGTYNVCGGIFSMADIVAAIASNVGVSVHRVPLPNTVLRSAALMSDTVRKFISDDVYDGSRFASTVNFSPAVGLTDGLGRQVAAS